ncbi:MAG: serine/threonine protein kinase [Proteobacteria bacterium]|nr:serine/threonine protein kinase [Pseudomonadota bacterium]
MASLCPQCKERFEEDSGYCPYDGTPLELCRDTGDTDWTDDATATASRPVKIELVSALDAPSVTAALRRLGPIQSQYDKLIGTVLDGRYEIQRKLGEGGMGVVFLAKHIVIEKLVAVKILKRGAARDQNVVRRFVQEARAASRIGHPNIVDVTDFGTTKDGMTYSVMEYVEGDTLSQLIAGKAPVEAARVLPVIAQLAKALGAAHAKGIVHRDLKPDNVFVLARDGRRDFVKIVDFGIAKVIPIDGDRENVRRLTHAGSVFGTPEYMAPEQAAGRSDTDHRIDIYSLGTIFYEMMVGQVPHKGDTTVRTLAMQMLDEVVPPRQVRPDLDISGDIEWVILKALAKKRTERIQTMSELLEHLERVSGGVPLEQPLSASARLARTAAAPDANTLVPQSLRQHLDAFDTISTTSRSALPSPDRSQQAPLDAGRADDSHRRSGEQPIGPAEHDAGAHSPPLHQVENSPGQKAPSQPHDGAAVKLTSLEKPRTEKKHQIDPAFVRRKRPITFDSVYKPTQHEIATNQPGARSRRLVMVSAAFLLVAASGLAMALWPEQTTELNGEASGQLPDAAPVLVAKAPDASPRTAENLSPADARVADAAHFVAAGSTEATTVPSQPSAKDPHTDEKLPIRKYREVKVLTRPDSASLYINDDYSGRSGTNIRREEGTEVTVECRLSGYSPGRVQIAFDGEVDVYTCRLDSATRCVKGIKNPFADCPE